MSTTKNIEFHIHETWRIFFACQEADGSIMTLPSGVDVQFRLSTSDNMTGAILTHTIGAGITVIDELAGTGSAIVTKTQQVDAAIVKKKEYFYELKVIKDGNESVQNVGLLKTLPSLFAA